MCCLCSVRVTVVRRLRSVRIASRNTTEGQARKKKEGLAIGGNETGPNQGVECRGDGLGE